MPPTLAQDMLHYAFALTTVLYIFVSTIVAVTRVEQKLGFTDRRRRVHLAILILITVSYIANAVLYGLQYNVLEEGEPRLIQLIVSTIAWSWIAFRASDPAYVLSGTAIVSALFGAPLLVFSFLARHNSVLGTADIAVQCSRLILLLIAIASSIHAARAASAQWEAADTVESAYHDDTQSETVDDTSSSASDDEFDSASIKKARALRVKEAGGWLTYIKEFSIFVPFLLPKNNRKVQLCFLISLVCVAGNRVLNVLIPRQLGIVTDLVLSKEPPYSALLVWLAMSLMDEYRGLGLVQILAKIPIQQFSYRAITNVSFNHLMTLSMDFHSDRDAAEVMKAIEQGLSLYYILETLAIDLVPMIIDIFIAVGFFWWKFNAYFGLTVLSFAIVFLSIEAVLLKKNMRNKRNASKAEREESRVMHQAVQGWQTVTYFNMLGFERRRYAQAVDTHQNATKDYETLDAITEAILESLEPITFVLLGSLVLYGVARGEASAGDFVFVLQYWQGLVWPVKLLSHNYKQILKSLVDAERLLALLQTKPTVADKPDALELGQIEGHVAFDGVNFCYDSRKPTIQDLSLSAEPGQTLAFVGATGAGKSTITKLLLRFYDVTSGSITIDGHDIRDITLNSLRSSLGVVPQDPLLFNASIFENLRYARSDATNEEIFEACRKASIHDKILGFADGYETKVGEQGVKLSGGEIQRLAIARVFLKDPPILILDEATSAIDSETEHSIQQALDELKKGRTTFVIAHRLSTIVSADKIMVIGEGQVLESGTHAELIQLHGRYSSLWSKQSGGRIE